MKQAKPFFLFLSMCLQLFCFSAYSQIQEKAGSSEEISSLLDVLLKEEIPTLEITTNIKTVFEDTRYQNYHWASGKFTLSDEAIIEENIQVRARGKFRSMFCENPPLKIKFYKKNLSDQNLKKWNEFKIVYPCNLEAVFQDYVLKEYLVYKLYNELTDYSYRVKLINLTLKDSTESVASKNYKAFLIEDVEELTDRMNTKKEKVDGVVPLELSADEYNLFQVFQFAIGNTDWFPLNSRNLDVIATKDGRLIPIPYDFDFSGMVAAGYASPNSEFNLSSVLERYFMGHQKTIEELNPVFEHFQHKKDNLIQIIRSFKELPAKDRIEMVRYLKSFYKILDMPDRKKKEFFVHAMIEEGVSGY